MDTHDTPPPDVIPDDLVDMRTAAGLARACLATLYRLIGVGNGRPPKLRAWKRSGRYFVSRAEVLGLFRPVRPEGGTAPTPAAAAQTEADRARWRDETLRRAGLHRDQRRGKS